MAQSKNGRDAKSAKAKRKPDGQLERLLKPTSRHPSEELPKWLRPSPGMDTAKYAETFGLAIHLDSLNRSLKGDTAAHAKWREQALKGLGLGQRQEIDISQRQPDWVSKLSDEGLLILKALKDSVTGQQIQLVSEGATVEENGGTPQEGGQ